MDQDAKKTALRMIPYGLYVLTGKSPDGSICAATVTWVTQASFNPPLVAVGVKRDSGPHAVVKQAGSFALNILGKGQSAIASAYFKGVEADDKQVGGHGYTLGESGAPLLDEVPAAIELELVDTHDHGDHSIFVGKVVGAHVRDVPEGRPDCATLVMADMGGKIFYGG